MVFFLSNFALQKENKKAQYITALQTTPL